MNRLTDIVQQLDVVSMLPSGLSEARVFSCSQARTQEHWGALLQTLQQVEQ